MFAGRFTIIDRIDRGGMGVVYKAFDRVLGQTVALKIILPQLARDPNLVERFKREARVTRQITHENVCRVHDIGDHEGVLFISMEWIDGETLRELLNHAGRLEESRALEIAEMIARALGAAHLQDVVHRDLKPENVMIDKEGNVVVMDFGLATDPAAGDGSDPSIVAGTPPYMAPEQQRGERVDARADLYSLGLILREMLTGQRPDPSDQGAQDSHPEVRTRINPLLSRLLERDRERRFSSAEEVVQRVQRLRARPGIGSRFTYSLNWFRWHKTRTTVAAGLLAISVVVVLYVVVLRAPPMRFPSTSEAFYQRGLHYLREETETTKSLDSAIQMFNRAIRTDSTYAQAWAALGEAYWIRFERLRDSASREEAIPAVERALELNPSLPEALNAKARGLIVEGEYEEAKEILLRVLAQDPEFDMAWTNLGRAHRWLGEYFEGREAVEHAIHLRPDSFQHQMYLGVFFQEFQEHEEAMRAYRRALELKPDSPMAWNNLGVVQMETGQHKEAIQTFLKAIEINDRASARTNLGSAYYFLGEFEEAVKHHRKATELDPQDPTMWGNLGDALSAVGEGDEARDAYLHAVGLARKEVELTPGDPLSRVVLAFWCARAGDEECAVGEGHKAADMQPESAEILYINAMIRCILRRNEDALDWLEKAVKLGVSRSRIETDPEFTPLHGLARYKRILELAG